MNIHIDEDAHLLLQRRSIIQIPIGGYMYKLLDNRSDKDILCIYAPNRFELGSVAQTHHQLQYKDEKNEVDYIYTSIVQYLRNLINGDSTINFEALYHPEMHNHNYMYKIWRHRNDFITYNLIKCYLGMARRDLKEIRSLKTDREKWNKLVHVVRGTEIAAYLYDTGGFSLNVFEIGHPFRENLKTIKMRNDHQFFCELSETLRSQYETKINDVRQALTEDFQAGHIKAYPRPEVMRELDSAIANAVNSSWHYDPQSLEVLDRNNYLDYFYHALYDGIKY